MKATVPCSAGMVENRLSRETARDSSQMEDIGSEGGDKQRGRSSSLPGGGSRVYAGGGSAER